ncbi:MAG: hypothetical protein ACRDYV_11205, partial [Acidimicrobiia bacterium]
MPPAPVGGSPTSLGEAPLLTGTAGGYPMLNRSRRSLLAALGLAVALSAMPSAEALYSPHNGVVSADPAEHTPHVVDIDIDGDGADDGGKVTTILPMGGKIYVGGTFTRVRNAGSAVEVARPGLFAFDAATGQIDMNFNPPAWGIDPRAEYAKGVEALAPGPGGTIFVGGAFSYDSPVSGGLGRKLLKLNGATGAEVAGFDVTTGASPVKDLAVVGDRLFVAGVFSKVQGVDHRGLAVVDVDDGALDGDFNINFTSPRQTTEVDPLLQKPR